MKHNLCWRLCREFRYSVADDIKKSWQK
jgi:hypothetical protein